ncbi:jg9443 [Pararge aegeria aegeria]|uniref:Jg9443 protein n=1 Tax=Pararge aegeria aegeria TaxID=348720 RepID=A0A8S4SMZ9_9NEOP|nr:jg9443 [Pararge aegeria aegeria]
MLNFFQYGKCCCCCGDQCLLGDLNSGVTIDRKDQENLSPKRKKKKKNYDTPTGISAHESGAPRAAGPEGPAVTAEGGFSYRAPDGQQISLTYTADENGFHPQGSHLPTPPPIPEAILRSLEYNRQHPSNEGSYNGQRNYY